MSNIGNPVLVEIPPGRIPLQVGLRLYISWPHPWWYFGVNPKVQTDNGWQLVLSDFVYIFSRPKPLPPSGEGKLYQAWLPGNDIGPFCGPHDGTSDPFDKIQYVLGTTWHSIRNPHFPEADALLKTQDHQHPLGYSCYDPDKVAEVDPLDICRWEFPLYPDPLPHTYLAPSIRSVAEFRHWCGNLQVIHHGTVSRGRQVYRS